MGGTTFPASSTTIIGKDTDVVDSTNSPPLTYMMDWSFELCPTC